MKTSAPLAKIAYGAASAAWLTVLGALLAGPPTRAGDRAPCSDGKAACMKESFNFEPYRGEKPGNHTRNMDKPEVPFAGAPDLPGFVAHGRAFARQGVAFGPGKKFSAAFNPTAFTGVDPVDGKEKVYMVIRGEEELPDAKVKKRSLPFLAVSEDGVHFKLVQEAPIFQANDDWDRDGGIEDTRYADLRLQPYVDPLDGRSFDGAIMYTAYDGKTPRVAKAFFNHGNLKEFRKKGPQFPDADVLRNPLMPNNAWNKSPSVIQYRDPHTGQVRNVMYVGEGNDAHGGIMAIEADSPFGFKWPAGREPAIRARPGKYDQNLVESAFAPVIAPLPPDLARKTGQTHGIYLSLHGDSRPMGYQVGYRIFSLTDPTGPPIYASDAPYFWPQEKYEVDGQVGNVVFVSGSVEFKGERFLYYGAADTYVGVAKAPAAPHGLPAGRDPGSVNAARKSR